MLVGFKLNGRKVELDVEPRTTLADSLRGDLGLTGTHIGCEHGVCGMCTVLVNGTTARSCLLFTCQLEGAEVVTIEGMGREDNLHPLQQAFHDHYALQCGFCTPAFVLSAYELLSTHPSLEGVDLPPEMSGIICRCTGYSSILAAIKDFAEAHPEGPPPPANLS